MTKRVGLQLNDKRQMLSAARLINDRRGHHVCLRDCLPLFVHLTCLLLFHSHHCSDQFLKVCAKSNFIDKYSNSTILIVQLSDGGQRGATNLSGAAHLAPRWSRHWKLYDFYYRYHYPFTEKNASLDISSLLFHAGQAAIKLPSAEASNWAQCCPQDNIQLTWRE